MRAISVAAPGGPEMLRMDERAIPSPRAGEVAIDVAYAGVGFVDTLFRRGVFPLPMPLTPGIEVSGHVRDIGPDVHHLAKGQSVAALLNDFVNLPGAGGYAEVALARAALTIPLRQNSDLATAAATAVNGTTAWLAIHDLAQLQAGETVLVPGAAGGLGSFLAQIARHARGRVFGLAASVAKQQVARDLGCEEVRSVSDPAWPDVLPTRGVDVVLDAVGGPARRLAFERLAPWGRLIILGDASGADSTFSGNGCWLGNKSVRGLNVGGIASLMPSRIVTAGRRVLDLIADGALLPPPTQIMPLADAAEAHRLIEGRRVTGKIVLDARIH
jgi:NADPH2:quinone reductase